MAKTATATRNNRRADIEDYLNDRQVQWEFLENVNPNSFDLQKSLHNQARLKHLVTPQVETYIDAMKRGDEFPPLIAHRAPDTNKLIVVDGNHRLEASRAVGRTVDVYVISAETQTITIMTYEANTKHGLPTSPEERVVHALWLIDSGASKADAAAAVGASLGAVNKAWTKKQAERRAQNVGIIEREWESLHQSVRNRLLNLQTDEVFKAATELAYKANLGSEETFEMVTALNESRSVTRQMAYIKALREGEYADRIAGGAAIFGSKAGRSKQTPKTQTNRLLSQLINLPEPPAIASMYSASERDSAAQRARDAAKRLGELADALEAPQS